MPQEGGELVADGFSAAGGHDRQRVPPGQNGADDLLLTGTKLVVAEVVLQGLMQLICHSFPPRAKFPAYHSAKLKVLQRLGE